MQTSPSSDRRETKKRSWVSCLFNVVVVLGILLILAGVALGPMPGGIRNVPASASMQQAHAIGLGMYSWANDNDQMYPDGKSSTEVFQKLMDGGYISDASVFYIAMPGKVRAEPGQKKLKPENVSFDVTGGGNSASSPDGLPVLFMTGYKVTYAAGAKAVPLVKPYPRFGWQQRDADWSDWILGRPTIHYDSGGGLAVFYKSNMSRFMSAVADAKGEYTVPNFVPPDFKPDGVVYRQLTPEGVLEQ